MTMQHKQHDTNLSSQGLGDTAVRQSSTLDLYPLRL